MSQTTPTPLMLDPSYSTTATAAGTTTLTVNSTRKQFFTGTTTQTVVMPVVSTLRLGDQYTITNLSTGVVTVQSSGANTIKAMAAGSQLVLTCIAITGTGTASWSFSYALLTGAATPPAQVTASQFGSRALATNYTNTSSQTRIVMVTLSASAVNSYATVTVNGVSFPTTQAYTASYFQTTFSVGAGEVYRIDNTVGSNTINAWVETN